MHSSSISYDYRPFPSPANGWGPATYSHHLLPVPIATSTQKNVPMNTRPAAQTTAARQSPRDANKSSAKRVNVACSRCRKRKVRCSGAPKKDVADRRCDSCITANVSAGECQFVRVMSYIPYPQPSTPTALRSSAIPSSASPLDGTVYPDPILQLPALADQWDGNCTDQQPLRLPSVSELGNWYEPLPFSSDQRPSLSAPVLPLPGPFPLDETYGCSPYGGACFAAPIPDFDTLPSYTPTEQAGYHTDPPFDLQPHGLPFDALRRPYVSDFLALPSSSEGTSSELSTASYGTPISDSFPLPPTATAVARYDPLAPARHPSPARLPATAPQGQHITAAEYDAADSIAMLKSGGAAGRVDRLDGPTARGCRYGSFGEGGVSPKTRDCRDERRRRQSSGLFVAEGSGLGVFL